MKNITVKHIILLVFMLLITARYMAAGWNRILFNSNSADGDQAAYLQLGLDVREHGIITDGKRNPLYPVVLATFAHREWSYFTWAKIFNFVVGLITIWAVYAIGGRLFDSVSGALAAFLLSINMEFIFHATFALAESLLILLVFLAWFAMVRALQKPEQLRYWVLGGVLAGLAYLAKGTAPLIAICFVITATLLHSYKIWFKRVFLGFVVAFCLVSLPLWLYSWVAFGSPLFNSAVNNVMWMDSATEKYVADTSTLPTLSSYLQDNSLGDAWDRLSEGLLAMRYFFARLLWPTRSLTFDNFFQAGGVDLIFISVIVILLASWRYLTPIVKRNRESLLLTGIMVGVFYVLFGWYIAISPFPIRFLLPLAPALFLLISAGVVNLVSNVFTTPKVPRWAKIAVGIAIFLLVLRPLGWFAVTGYLIGKGSLQNAFAADTKFNDFTDQALQWVQSGHDKEESVGVMWGPTHKLPVWRHTDQLNLIRTPVAEARTTDELEAFMAASNITYVIVDSEMIDRLGEENAAQWGIFRREDDRIELESYPSDWALGFTGPEMPCQWCVFRRLSAPPAIELTNYTLGDSIFLFGYELETDQFYPGGQLVVTLYWASLQPVSVDYTTFTQLLGPDFQLHGQMDRQPLSGHWPTSRWQPEQKFVDKFVLPIDEAAPIGNYVLLVGLYDGNTGQRLQAKDNDQPIHEDAIPLVHLPMSQAEVEVQGAALGPGTE